jgi:hypothetical protein
LISKSIDIKNKYSWKGTASSKQPWQLTPSII